MNGVVQVYAAPTPSLSPTPGGLWVFFFKCQAEHFEHWLESIIHRQIFRRVLSSLDAEDVCPQQPSLLCFGVRLKKSRERLKMSKFVVKVRYPLFGLVSFQVHLMLYYHMSQVPLVVSRRWQWKSIHHSTNTGSSRFTKGRTKGCCTSQHSKQLQVRVF